MNEMIHLTIVMVLLIPLLILLIIKKSFIFSIRAIGAYVLLSITLLVIPYFQSEQSELYVFESILHTMKSMVLNNDSTVVTFFAHKQEGYAQVYSTVLYIFYVMSPLFTLGVSLSFFERRLNYLIYLWLSLFKSSIIFSEYNQKTEYFGEYLKDKRKRVMIVYLTKPSDQVNYAFLKKIKALSFYKNIDEIKHTHWHSREAYLLSKDEVHNINDAMSIINASIKGPLFRDIHLSYQGEAPKLVFTSITRGIHIHWIEEELLLTDELLQKSPLYKAINDQQELNVLIIGLGKVGKEVLRQICIMSSMSRHINTQIVACDLYASKIKKEMMLKAHDFYDDFKVSFLDVNVLDHSLNEMLKNLTFRPTYIVLSLVEQQMSIETAILLKRFYATEEKYALPKIHIAIDNEKTKIHLISQLKEKYYFDSTEQSYQLITFGHYKENYRRYIDEEKYINVLCRIKDDLLHHEEDYLLNQTYVDLLDRNHERDSKNLDYKNTRSFLRHLPTKLFFLGFNMEFKTFDYRLGDLKTYLNEQSSLLDLLKERLNEHIEELIEMDGKRWNHFKRLDGYQPLDISDMTDHHYQLIMNKKHVLLGNDRMEDITKKMDKPLDYFKNIFVKDIKSIPSMIKIYHQFASTRSHEVPLIHLSMREDYHE